MKVTGKNRNPRIKTTVDGVHTSAGGCLIHHIVMNEGGGVDHLRDFRQTPMRGVSWPSSARARGEQQNNAGTRRATCTEEVLGRRLKDGMTGTNQAAQSPSRVSRSVSTGCSSSVTVTMKPLGAAILVVMASALQLLQMDLGTGSEPGVARSAKPSGSAVTQKRHCHSSGAAGCCAGNTQNRIQLAGHTDRRVDQLNGIRQQLLQQGDQQRVMGATEHNRLHRRRQKDRDRPWPPV